MEVVGSGVVYKPFPYDPVARNVNFRQHMVTIHSAMADLFQSENPNLLGIEGVSGTGKSGLAVFLAYYGKKTKVINVESLRSDEVPMPDISGLLVDKDITYIIDELGLLGAPSLKAINDHVMQGGIAVVMCQSRHDVAFSCDIKWLKLTRQGLV